MRHYAGSIRCAGEWVGVHVLRPTKPGWNEFRIDYPCSSESGVVRDKDCSYELPEVAEEFEQ